MSLLSRISAASGSRYSDDLANPKAIRVKLRIKSQYFIN
jgi:hypothetical protein